MSTTLDNELIRRCARQLAGAALSPRDPGYDKARAVHNGLVDRSPAAIVRARTAGDVAAALAFARRAGLEVSVRGGGHNVAGTCRHRRRADDRPRRDERGAVDPGARPSPPRAADLGAS